MTEPRPDIVPPGWTLQRHFHTFSGHAGPFWFRDGETPGVGFVAEPRHANMQGSVHGGMLTTLADMALWDVCVRAVGPFGGVTVTMNAEFLAPGAIGDFVEATGEAVKIGRKLMFVRGLVTARGAALLSFSGTLKRLSAAPSG